MTHAPGAQILDDLRDFVGRFVIFPSEHALAAVTLWCAHSHLVEQTDSTPRLALLSPEPASGKSRTLEVLELLVARPLLALNASPAAIFRSIEDEQPTLLFDEVDTIFTRQGKDDGAEDLRGLLNAGHRRGAMVPRCVGPRHDVHKFPVFAAAALAGLGDLPETLMTRAVVIRMVRRARHERIASFRRREVGPAADDLRDRLAEWAASVRTEVTDAWPTMPTGIEDRPADVWEPLLAVADAAGAHWPATARAACVALCADAQANSASLGVRLLDDLRAVFGDATAKSTASILDALVKIDESPWADLRGKPLDARGLASRLRQYGIRSTKVHVPGDAKKLQGYRAEDLYDAWLRYTPSDPANGERPEPPEPRRSEALFEVPAPGEVPEPAADPEPSTPPLTSQGSAGSGLAGSPAAGEVACAFCGEPLDAASLAGGFDLHRHCDLELSLSEGDHP